MSDKHSNNFAQSKRYHDDWDDRIGEIYDAEDLAYFADLERKERERVAKNAKPCQMNDRLNYGSLVWGGGGMTRSEERDQRFEDEQSYRPRR